MAAPISRPPPPAPSPPPPPGGFPQCHILWDRGRVALANPTDQCSVYYDLLNAAEYKVQYPRGYPEATDANGNPLVPHLVLPPGAEEVEFPGDAGVVKIRQGSDRVLCVDLNDAYQFSQSNPNLALSRLWGNSYPCTLGAEDREQLALTWNQLNPEKIPVGVPEAERKERAEEILDPAFVGVLQSIGGHRWLQNMNILYNELNKQNNFSMLEMLGLESIIHRQGNQLEQWLSYIQHHVPPAEWIPYYDKLNRAVIICGWYKEVSIGPYDTLRKLEMFWSTYYRGSRWSDFPTLRDLLDYWMTLPFTDMRHRDPFVRLDEDSLLSPTPARGMLQNEVIVWQYQVQREYAFYLRWLSERRDPSGYLPFLDEQWRADRFNSGDREVADKARMYRILNTTAFEPHLQQFYRNYWGVRTNAQADAQLRKLFDAKREEFLSSFSSFNNGRTSWVAHLSRLFDDARARELLWLQYDLTAHKSRVISFEVFANLDNTPCSNRPSLDTLQYFQTDARRSRGRKILLLLPSTEGVGKFAVVCTTAFDLLQLPRTLRQICKNTDPSTSRSTTEAQEYSRVVELRGLQSMVPRRPLALPDPLILSEEDFNQMAMESNLEYSTLGVERFKIFEIQPSDRGTVEVQYVDRGENRCTGQQRVYNVVPLQREFLAMTFRQGA